MFGRLLRRSQSRSREEALPNRPLLGIGRVASRHPETST
jgi:hypothetical protein